MGYFFQGLTLGLAYVAPIGMQNLFVINSALTCPRGRALLTTWIVIFFDVTLALACFFGIGTVMERYAWLQMLILLAGSLVVIYMGVRLLRSKAAELENPHAEMSVRKTVTSACVVTWFNPQAIIDGTMIFGAFRVTLPAEQANVYIAGVALASCLWFTGLTLVISVFSSRFHAGVLRIINMICGAVMSVYGFRLFLDFVEMLF